MGRARLAGVTGTGSNTAADMSGEANPEANRRSCASFIADAACENAACECT